MEISQGEWKWSEAMLYPVLHRLNSEGLIQSRWEVQENGRKRKYYGLTDSGKAALQTEREHWLTIHNALQGLWNGLDLSPVKK